MGRKMTGIEQSLMKDIQKALNGSVRLGHSMSDEFFCNKPDSLETFYDLAFRLAYILKTTPEGELSRVIQNMRYEVVRLENCFNASSLAFALKRGLEKSDAYFG